MTQDPGATHNFATQAFTKGMGVLSRSLALSLKVLGDKMINQDAREYNLILKDMHRIRHSVTG